jgi:hypothetical protein
MYFIGILSKRSSWIFTDNLYNLPILRTSYIALSALSERCFLVTSKLHVFVKITLFVMLYADYTILLAESAEDLQVQLNAFGEYCDNWKMKVNVNKTKIMVFGFGKLRQNLKFATI